MNWLIQQHENHASIFLIIYHPTSSQTYNCLSIHYLSSVMSPLINGKRQHKIIQQLLEKSRLNKRVYTVWPWKFCFQHDSDIKSDVFSAVSRSDEKKMLLNECMFCDAGGYKSLCKLRGHEGHVYRAWHGHGTVLVFALANSFRGFCFGTSIAEGPSETKRV